MKVTNTSLTSRRNFLRRFAAAALVAATAGAVSPVAFAKEPESGGGGGKEVGAFTVTLGNGQTFSGKQKVTIPAADAANQFAFVKGKFVEFMVNLDTFTVTNYALTGAVSKANLSRGKYTMIFASKTPEINANLTGGVSLTLSAEQFVLIRGGAQTTLKIQAKDISTGGMFQMEGERGVKVAHQLAPGFHYAVDALGRTVFTNGVFLGRESPEIASLIAVSGPQSSRWMIQAGGRMGMVLGEDAAK